MKSMPNIKEHEILTSLNDLPRKIVSLHGMDNVPEFVLYDLCHESCFNLPQAAYLVDNPDFNCLKGVAGICKGENGFCQNLDIWKNPEEYSAYMQQSPFNNKVRQLTQCSIVGSSEASDKALGAIAHQLGFSNPDCYSWLMKHDNHGYLIVEHNTVIDNALKEHLKNSAYFLSFCPIH